MTAFFHRATARLLGQAIGLTLAGLPLLLPVALANGRFPQAGQVAVDPGGSQRLVVRATFGLLVSDDAGQTWGWVCEAAPGYQDATDPYVLLLGEGRLAVATTTGLVQSTDLGCSWLPAAGLVGSGAVADLVAGPKPGEALALYAGSPDPQSGLLAAAVWQTIDAGASWQPLGQPLPPLVQALTVEVAPSEPQVIYVSGIQAAGGKPRNVLLQSVNSGKTWQVAMVPGSGTPWLAAVDPTNAQRVWLRRSAPGLGDSLARSDDGGATWTEVFAASGSMRGFALAPDGSQWLGRRGWQWFGPVPWQHFQHHSATTTRQPGDSLPALGRSRHLRLWCGRRRFCAGPPRWCVGAVAGPVAPQSADPPHVSGRQLDRGPVSQLVARDCPTNRRRSSQTAKQYRQGFRKWLSGWASLVRFVGPMGRTAGGHLGGALWAKKAPNGPDYNGNVHGQDHREQQPVAPLSTSKPHGLCRHGLLPDHDRLLIWHLPAVL
jgi:hypothetical protein